jgi:hypothetical protein
VSGSGQGLLDAVIGLAGDVAGGGSVRVSVKTNLGPELEVATVDLGSSGGGGGQSTGGLSSLFGVKAAVILRNDAGATLATFGEPPATEPLRLALLAGVALLVLVLAVRGLRR